MHPIRAKGAGDRQPLLFVFRIPAGPVGVRTRTCKTKITCPGPCIGILCQSHLQADGELGRGEARLRRRPNSSGGRRRVQCRSRQTQNYGTPGRSGFHHSSARSGSHQPSTGPRSGLLPSRSGSASPGHRRRRSRPAGRR